MRQTMPLDYKIQFTKSRIKQFYNHYERKAYIAWSKGKDSTVLLHIARQICPDIEAVFIDTGLEYPEIRNFGLDVENVTIIKPKMSFRKVIEKYGFPVISKEQSQFISQYRNAKSEKTKQTRWNGNKYGMGKISEKWKYLVDAPFKISDKCCDVMKKNPAKDFEKRTGKYPILGTMTEESKLREQKYLKTGCNAFEAKRPNSTPLAFWTTADIWEYIKKYNVKYSPIYDIGYERTGCMFCCFGITYEYSDLFSKNRFQRMKQTHPKQWNYCINKLGCGKVLDYINVSYS